MINLQYITDGMGNVTGVFIPINDWNALKSDFKNLDNLVNGIPKWQANELDLRLSEYFQNQNDLQNFDGAMKEIENSL